MLGKAFYYFRVVIWEILDIVGLGTVLSHPRVGRLRTVTRQLAHELGGEAPDEVEGEFAIEGHRRRRPMRLVFETVFERCIVHAQSATRTEAMWGLSCIDGPKKGNQWERKARGGAKQLTDQVEVWGIGWSGTSAVALFEQLPEDLRGACLAMVEQTRGSITYDEGEVVLRPADDYLYGPEAGARIRDDMELAWHIADAMDRMLRR